MCWFYFFQCLKKLLVPQPKSQNNIECIDPHWICGLENIKKMSIDIHLWYLPLKCFVVYYAAKLIDTPHK